MICMGLDIGGTKCAVSVGKTDGGAVRLFAREEVPTRNSPQETFALLTPAIRAFMHDYPVARAGISCGGPLDSERGVILSPPNLRGWHGFCITEYVRSVYGLASWLENDANACALAEWKFGAGRGTRNMIFLTFGTGLGAGLILDGRLYSGTNGNAGEVGHMRLEKSGPVGFGKAGSFEGFCSGGGIAALAERMASKLPEMPACIADMGGYGNVTTKKLAQAARAGDDFAKKVFAASGARLGRGLAVLVDILNPEVIVLGGVFMRSSDLLVPAMEKTLVREALTESLRVCRVLPAELKENIGDYAALAVAESYAQGDIQ